jgi:hypothetical protein
MLGTKSSSQSLRANRADIADRNEVRSLPRPGPIAISEHGLDPFRNIDARNITKVRQTVTLDQKFFEANHPF